MATKPTAATRQTWNDFHKSVNINFFAIAEVCEDWTPEDMRQVTIAGAHNIATALHNLSADLARIGLDKAFGA